MIRPPSQRPTLDYFALPPRAAATSGAWELLLRRSRTISLTALACYLLLAWLTLAPFARLVVEVQRYRSINTPYIRDAESLLITLLFLGVWGRIVLLLAGFTLARPDRSQALALSRRSPALRLCTFALWNGVLITLAWTLWLHVHNAPIRRWWHPWIDYAPALQALLLIGAALMSVAAGDVIDSVVRRRANLVRAANVA